MISVTMLCTSAIAERRAFASPAARGNAKPASEGPRLRAVVFNLVAIVVRVVFIAVAFDDVTEVMLDVAEVAVDSKCSSQSRIPEE